MSANVPVGFNHATQRYFRTAGTVPYQANTPNSIKLLNIGFLAAVHLIVNISGTITLNGGTSVAKNTRGKVIGNQTPMDILPRVQFKNNQNVPIVDTSLWGLYLWTLTQRTNYDPLNLRATSGISTDVFDVPTSGAVTTFDWHMPITIPIAYKPSLQGGLILMQNQQTDMRIDFQWGDAQNVVVLAGGATLTNVVASVEVVQEYFMAPDNTADYPDLSFVHRIIETTQDIVGTGQNGYRPQLTTNDVMARLIQEYVNNSAGMAPSSFNQFQLIYSGSDYVTDMGPYQFIAQNVKETGGFYLPTGVFSWTFDAAYGFPEVGTDRDVIRLGDLTDLEFRSNIAPSVAISGAYMRNIRELFSY